MDCIYLKDAKYVRDFVIWLQFNNGCTGEVDLKDIVFKHDIATPIRTPKTFSRFYLDSWPTLAWDCGFDIAPEALYDRCKNQSSSV